MDVTNGNGKIIHSKPQACSSRNSVEHNSIQYRVPSSTANTSNLNGSINEAPSSSKLVTYRSTLSFRNDLNAPWIFPKAHVFPSIVEAMSLDLEISHRRNSAKCIQKMAEMLNRDSRSRMSQHCICTAMMHMHRFFSVHSFQKFDGKDIGAACLFLAGKSEESPRKVELVAQTLWMYKYSSRNGYLTGEELERVVKYITYLEHIVLATVAFHLSVDLPHKHILNHMPHIATVLDTRKLSEIAFWLASDVLHMTDWGVRYFGTTIACVCINLACLWAGTRIERAENEKPWYQDVDSSLHYDELMDLTEQFSNIYTRYGNELNIRRFVRERGGQHHSAGTHPSINCKITSNQACESGPSQALQRSQRLHQTSLNLSTASRTHNAEGESVSESRSSVKLVPARKIAINEYKQRSGVTSQTVISHESNDRHSHRRNFMLPDRSPESSESRTGDKCSTQLVSRDYDSKKQQEASKSGMSGDANKRVDGVQEIDRKQRSETTGTSELRKRHYDGRDESKNIQGRPSDHTNTSYVRHHDSEPKKMRYDSIPYSRPSLSSSFHTTSTTHHRSAGQPDYDVQRSSQNKPHHRDPSYHEIQRNSISRRDHEHISSPGLDVRNSSRSHSHTISSNHRKPTQSAQQQCINMGSVSSNGISPTKISKQLELEDGEVL